MKIVTNNSAFVQKNDLAYLDQSDLAIPASIYRKILNLIIDDHNRYDFATFTASKEIEFFKSIDWMVDYNEIKDLSEQEIMILIQNALEKKNRIIQKFNSMETKNRDMVLQCELLDFKIYSLRDALWFKQGYIKIKLPEGVEFLPKVEPEKNIKKRIRTLFDKEN